MPWKVIGAIASVVIAIVALLDFLLGYNLLGWPRSPFAEVGTPAAKIDVWYRERHGGKNRDLIVVENAPDAEKSAKLIEIQAVDQDGVDPLSTNQVDMVIGNYLAPNQRMKFEAVRSSQCRPPHDVEVTWEEDGNEHMLEKKVCP